MTMTWIGRIAETVRAWRPTRRAIGELAIALLVPFGWLILVPRLVPVRIVRPRRAEPVEVRRWRRLGPASPRAWRR